MKSLRRLRPFLLLMIALSNSGCAVHRFLLPTKQWTARSGQVSVRGRKISLIGEVLVRFTSRGDFELTLTKGSALQLLTLRSDDKFVRLQGPLVRVPWSGKISESQAPARCQSWIALRAQMLQRPQETTYTVSAAGEKLVVRF
ncbi:MAG: hypothetical protein M3R59_09910 [Verrucomicrobiota bacterium]|nr:hypothetical protein [Verrucomicrobiota bacterium]